jgi:glycosyltransferase involved in cell wall biosynthesis
VLTLSGFARTAARAAALPAGRVVLVHRAACLAGPPFIEKKLSGRGHPLVYDFDDAIFRLHTSGSNAAMAWLKQPGKTATICRISDHVVVGNNYLSDWALRHNSCVTVVPTSVDTDRCRPPASPRPPGRVVVGWTGSATSQTYLEAFAPMLRTLLATNDVELRVLSTREPDLPGIPHAWRRWTPANEADEVAAFDIGIMPMPDEAWALGKCALKALQYMAAGVPTVASALGANREVIRHGHNGMLATTTEEWLEALRSLIEDPGLRSRLGQAGRRAVEERYSMRTSAAKFETVIREVVRGRRERA